MAVTAVCLALLACRQPPEEQPANDTQNTTTARPLPVAEPPLDRPALLMAAIRAASAYAAGLDDGGVQRELDGKRFELRVRFGCPSLSELEKNGPFSAKFDESDRTLRLRAAPRVEAEDAAVGPIVGEDVEAVEGFWIRRSWLLETACPVAQPKTEGAEEEEGIGNREGDSTVEKQPPAMTGGRIGIVQLFTESDARSRRRDSRAYQTTKVLKKDQMPSASGYNLVLSGRLRKLPDGRVIACSGPAAQQPPDCVISAQFDRVWMERADTGELIAEWGAV